MRRLLADSAVEVAERDEGGLGNSRSDPKVQVWME